MTGDNTEVAAASINEALTSPSIVSQDQHSADPLFASLNSKITSSPEVNPGEEPIDSFANPEVQISGKIPSVDNLENVISETGDNLAQVSKPSGR